MQHLVPIALVSSNLRHDTADHLRHLLRALFHSIVYPVNQSSGARVSLAFIHTMLNPVLKTEPEDFKSCPFLLVHPAEDHWTDLKYSLLFYQRLACEKHTIILEGAGHFPIEEPGLMQLEQACVAFLESHL